MEVEALILFPYHIVFEWDKSVNWFMLLSMPHALLQDWCRNVASICV